MSRCSRAVAAVALWEIKRLMQCIKDLVMTHAHILQSLSQ
jgi:hypothetical protein